MNQFAPGMRRVFAMGAALLVAVVISGCASQAKLNEAAKEGDIETVEALAGSGLNLHQPDDAGLTPFERVLASYDTYALVPLWAQVEYQRSATEAKQLLSDIFDNQISVREFTERLSEQAFYLSARFNGYTLLSHLAREDFTGAYIEYAEALLKHGVGITTEDAPEVEAVANAVALGNELYLSLFIDYNAYLGYVADVERSMVHLAIESQASNMLAKLLQAGASTAFYDDEGFKPLMRAVALGNGEAVEQLLAAGADVNATAPATLNGEALDTHSGWTPLMLAVFEGDVGIARQLLQAGSSINLEEDDGWTALHFTANNPSYGNRRNDEELVSLLISYDADIEHRQSTGNTALYLAAVNSRQSVLQKLLRLGANPNAKTDTQWTPLHGAVFYGNLAGARELLLYGSDPNDQEEEGWTPLHLTANTADNGQRTQDANLAQLLVEQGAQLHIRKDDGATPLLTAVSNARTEVVDTLLALGADPDSSDIEGWAPLHQAIYDGQPELVRRLIEGGSDLNRPTKSGWTPVQFTANSLDEGNRDHDVEILQLLIDAGADTNLVNNVNSTPLFTAVANDRLELLALLADEAVVNVQKEGGFSPLYEAVAQRSIPAAQLLLEHGANLDLATDGGFTPLMKAVYEGHPEMVKLLLNWQANPNIALDDGWTALHYTVNGLDRGNRENDELIIRYLIGAGSNIEARTDADYTPFLLAAANNRQAEAEVLAQLGADLFALRRGNTAEQIAEDFDNDDLARLYRLLVEEYRR